MRKAGLTGVVLVLTLTLVAFWWWQRPRTNAVAADSLVGVLVDENNAGYSLATVPGAIRFPGIWVLITITRRNGGITPVIWKLLTVGFSATSLLFSAGLSHHPARGRHSGCFFMAHDPGLYGPLRDK